MLIIRLVRTGKKNAPSFRLVLVKKTAPPKSGRFLEVLGSYNPRQLVKKGAASGKKEINLKTERIKHWLSQGVKTSGTVHNLLIGQGLIKGPKIKKKISARGGSASGEKVEKGEKAEGAKEVQESAESRLVGEAVEEKESVVKEKEIEKKKKIVKQEKKIKEEIEKAKEDKKPEKTVKPEQKPEQKEIGLDKSAEKSKVEEE
jgi:small subunit ribosomal protein S16